MPVSYGPLDTDASVGGVKSKVKKFETKSKHDKAIQEKLMREQAKLRANTERAAAAADPMRNPQTQAENPAQQAEIIRPMKEYEAVNINVNAAVNEQYGPVRGRRNRSRSPLLRQKEKEKEKPINPVNYKKKKNDEDDDANPGSVKKLKDGEREAYKKRTGQDVPVSKKQKKQDAEQQRLLALANVNVPSEPPPAPPPAAAPAAPKAKAKAAAKAKAVPIKQVGVEKYDNRTKAYWKG